MADVEIRFIGDDASAVDAVHDLDKALELLQGIIESVQRALGDLKIGSGVVTKFVADTKVMSGALGDLEDQANDTRRSLSMISMAAMGGAASTMLASAMRGMPFVGYPGARDQGPFATPITGFVSGRDPGSGWAQMHAAQEQQRAAQASWAAAHGLSGSARDLDLAATLIAARGGAGAGGGGGGGGAGLGLLAAMGWGRGGFGVSRWLNPFGRFGFRVPGAQIGSLLGLAGFGAERFLGTGLGITGSLLGAGVGAGLYGLGLGGTMAVGMGTDLAGIGQAAGDMRTVAKDMNALSTAVQEYGKNSLQAAQAQSQLNQDLNAFSPVARQAVQNAAQASNSFKSLFDYFTGPAERTGANIITQGIHTAGPFLPVIGKFAAGNMDIIQKGLQPFFKWADSQQGGLGIFTQLEKLFQQRLPTAVHAGTQAMELFSHATLDAAKQTGGFLPKIDEFLTKMNTPQGLARMNAGIVKMIDLFRAWMGLVLAVGKGVYELFRPAVGLGEDFAKQLTSIVNLFDKWLAMTSTQTTLHNLFSAHRQQLDALFSVLKALMPLLESAILAFAKIETVVTNLTVGPLKLLADLLNLILHIPFVSTLGGWAIAIALVYRGMKALLELQVVGTLTSWVGAEGAAATASEALAAKTGLATDAFAAFRLRLVAVLGPIAVAAAAVYALDKAFAKLTGIDMLKTDLSTGKITPDVRGGHNPWPVGTAAWAEWQAGYEGLKSGKIQGNKIDPSSSYYKQGARYHRQHPHGSGGGGGPQGSSILGTAAWAMQQPGASTSYQFGGTPGIGKGTHTDCSGFTKAVYAQHGIDLPRTSEAQYVGPARVHGREVRPKHPTRGELQPGDLVFFDYEGPHSHVGIYAGGDAYIGDQHTGSGITTAAMDWSHYDGAARYTDGGAGAATGGGGFNWKKSLAQANAQTNKNLLNTAVPQSLLGGGGSSRQSVLAQGQGVLQSIGTAIGDLGSLPSSWRSRFMPTLDQWKATIERLDKELHDKGLSQATVDKIRGRIDLISRAVQGMTQRIQTAIAAFQQLNAGRTLLHDVNLALGGNLFQLGVEQKPLNPMNVNVLQTTRAQLTPQLDRWKQELEKWDKELRDKGISQATVNAITQRMDAIQNKITGALNKIKQAAQTQLAAAQSAWSAFMGAFDAALPGNTGGASAQLQAAQAQLAKDRLAVALDQAQSAILGGSTNDNLAQQIVDNMTVALGIQTTGTGIAYTQQQLDNWLNLWGAYYASLGYTPQQMFDAFNKLLASVGLPPIDNPFSTGDLPLPPGMSGSGTGSSAYNLPGPGQPDPWWSNYVAAGAFKTKPIAAAYSSRPVAAVARAGAPAATAVHVDARPHVQVSFASGMEWLGEFVSVTVDGHLAAQGQKANARARSGRI